MTRKKDNRRGGGQGGFYSSGAARGNRRPNSSGDAPPSARADGPRRRDAVSPNRRHGFAGGKRPYEYSYYESEPATPEYMARLFASYDFKVTKEQLRRYWQMYDLLRRYNASLDLTRIMGIEATVLKHFIDSAIVLKHIDLPGPVLDIGTGPGFPGVPLAIMLPDTHFILAESRGKRVTFLEEVRTTLRLDNTEIFSRSVREDSALGHEHGKPVATVITRALETMPPTLERVLPFLEPGGRVVFMKGPGCDQEAEEAREAYRNVYRLLLDVEYDLPKTDQHRRLLAFERI